MRKKRSFRGMQLRRAHLKHQAQLSTGVKVKAPRVQYQMMRRKSWLAYKLLNCAVRANGDTFEQTYDQMTRDFLSRNKDIKCSERTTQRNIKELIDIGLIKVERTKRSDLIITILDMEGLTAYRQDYEDLITSNNPYHSESALEHAQSSVAELQSSMAGLQSSVAEHVYILSLPLKSNLQSIKSKRQTEVRIPREEEELDKYADAASYAAATVMKDEPEEDIPMLVTKMYADLKEIDHVQPIRNMRGYAVAHAKMLQKQRVAASYIAPMPSVSTYKAAAPSGGNEARGASKLLNTGRYDHLINAGIEQSFMGGNRDIFAPMKTY